MAPVAVARGRGKAAKGKGKGPEVLNVSDSESEAEEEVSRSTAECLFLFGQMTWLSPLHHVWKFIQPSRHAHAKSQEEGAKPVAKGRGRGAKAAKGKGPELLDVSDSEEEEEEDDVELLLDDSDGKGGNSGGAFRCVGLSVCLSFRHPPANAHLSLSPQTIDRRQRRWWNGVPGVRCALCGGRGGGGRALGGGAWDGVSVYRGMWRVRQTGKQTLGEWTVQK